MGVNWRRIVTLHNVNETQNYLLDPPAISVDNSAIHCGVPNNFKCGNVVYIRSSDYGTTWTNRTFSAESGQSYAQSPPIYIASNQPYVHYFTYNGNIAVRTSPNGGLNWPEDWSYLPTSPRPSSTPTSAGLGNSFYVLWSDQERVPTNEELFFMKTDDGGNTWYSYDPVPVSPNPQRLTFAEGKSRYPDVTVNNYGIHLVWTDNRTDPISSTAYEIYYKYSTNNGQTWSEDVPLTVDQGDSSFYPAIAAYNDGLHVVFQDKRESENLIFYKRSLDNGQTWQDEYAIGSGIQPDIFADREGLHVVYEYNGTVRYRQSQDFGNTWSWHPNGVNISYDINNITDTLRAYLPRICNDYRGRHIVWYKYSDENAVQSRLQYRQYDILPPEPPRNLRIKYITELDTDNRVVICFDWVPNIEPDIAGYDLYRRPWWGVWQKINNDLITDNAFFDTIPYNEVFVYYLVDVDQTVNMSTPSNFVVYYPPDYKSDIGKDEPSVYLVQRDSFIQWDNNSAKTADIDNNQLIYRFQNLNPDMIYELGIVYYRGDEEERTQLLKIDGVEMQNVEIKTIPEMYVFRIPTNNYVDGEIYIYIEKILGPNAVVSELYLWEFSSGGGSQSCGNTGINQFALSINPNIFKNSTTISFEFPYQSNV